ncbi:MAG: tetratricopeptide repeat protein, partial [Bacillota bacterium]
MHRKNLQRWLTFLLAVVFLCTTAFPAWAADNGKHSGKGVNFSATKDHQIRNQDRDSEKNAGQIKDQDRNRDRERTREEGAVTAGNGLKLRLEVELEKETEAGLEDYELPEKHDRAGLQKLAEKLAAKLDAQPGDVKIMHRLAVYYRNLGEYDKAIELCKEILAADPANQAALVLMALSYRAKGDIAAAIEQLQQLLAEKETVGHSVYAYLGILHEAAGNLARAVESVEK